MLVEGYIVKNTGSLLLAIDVRDMLIQAGPLIIHWNILPLQPHSVITPQINTFATIQPPSRRELLEFDFWMSIPASARSTASTVTAHNNEVFSMPTNEVKRDDGCRKASCTRTPGFSLYLKVLVGKKIGLRPAFGSAL